MRIYNFGLQTLNGSRVSLHSSILSPQRSGFSLLCGSGLGSDFWCGDPDPAFKNDADPESPYYLIRYGTGYLIVLENIYPGILYPDFSVQDPVDL
jgi:hypothetical protein